MVCNGLSVPLVLLFAVAGSSRVSGVAALASSAVSGGVSTAVFLRGRPLMGLSASMVSFLLNAGLQSAQALTSLRTSPDLVSPTFISNVDLDGRDKILKGPL